MNRRAFLKLTGSGALIAGGGLAWGQAGLRPLPVIPMTDLTGGITDRIKLALRAATHDFGNGAASNTFGINRSYLGPVLRVKQGQTLPFEINNDLQDVTTIHWHGLHIPGDVDGGPHQEIAPGAIWSPDVPIVQNASMNWYHSHMHGRTAQQTYNGLAGVMLIEDDGSLSADLPTTYGVDDFTLILQDKAFDPSGRMTYELTGEVFEDGFEGETLVVNGAIAPLQQAVPAGLVRLRLLNACNARFLNLSMQSGPLTVIASDGGFLGSAVETDSILMSPGERYEVLVDMSAFDRNTLNVDLAGGNGGGLLANLFGGHQTVPALTLTQNGEIGFTGAMPNTLATLAPPDRSLATVSRSFELGMDGNQDLAATGLGVG